MSLKLFITATALALLLVLTSAHPLPHQRRDISPFGDSLSNRALIGRSLLADDTLEPRTPPPPGGWRTSAKRKADHKAAGKPVKKSRGARNAARAGKGKAALPTRKANNKARAADRRAKKAKGEALPSLNKAGKKPPPARTGHRAPRAPRAPGAPRAKKNPNPHGAVMAKHVADTRAAKYKAKNDARNASAAKNGKGPVAYAASKKGLKDANTKRLKAEQRADDQAMHAIKTAGRPPKSKTEIANEKAERKLHLANAKAEHTKSLATGTFPGRNAKFTTAKGNVFTGKDVRQAAFTAHLSAQKPVGFKLSDGSTMKTKDRHPKEFQNREQGPPGAKSKPLPDISATGDKYREYGIVHDKMKGYDGRSPNPTEARLITKQNAAGVHEFAGVVAHPNSSGPDKNDHNLITPTY